MKLYRPFVKDPEQEYSVFFDATASLAKAVRVAELVQRREPGSRVTVEAEEWPRLSRLGYYLHLLVGTDEGFGANFASRNGGPSEIGVTVWPLDDGRPR